MAAIRSPVSAEFRAKKFPGVFFCVPVRIFRNIPNYSSLRDAMRCRTACNTNTHARTGNIQVLKSCPNLTSVNFYCCKNIEGEHTSNGLSLALLCAPVRTFCWNFPDHSPLRDAMRCRTASNTNTPHTNRQHPSARELPEPDQRELLQD